MDASSSSSSSSIGDVSQKIKVEVEIEDDDDVQIIESEAAHGATKTKDALEQLAEAEVDEIEVKPDLTLLDEPEVNFVMKQELPYTSDPLDMDEYPGLMTMPPDDYQSGRKFDIEDLTCKFCNRVFQYPWIVQVHMNTHTGSRPYKCEYCDKCFSSSGTLSNHRTIHKTVKPFQCGYCDKSFGRRYQLQTHELIHTGEKGYHRCQRCNESFRRKQECAEHEMSCTRTEKIQPQIRYGKLKRRRQKKGNSEEIDAKVNLHLDIEIKEENYSDYY